VITIVSGLPGHGKSLFTLYEIHSEFGGKRPIWYVTKEAVDEAGAGIAGVTLDGWTGFVDATEWQKCPDGAIIVIDECQYVFPKRGNSKEKEPAFISAFAEHRKKGFDIYLISQDARNIDHFIRRLAGRHIHYWRPMGAAYATRWEYARCVDNPFDRFVQKDAISRKVVKHPRRFYEVYSSANVHTVKRSFPKKLLLIPLSVLSVVAGGAYAYSRLSTAVDRLPGPVTAVSEPQAKPGGAVKSGAEAGRKFEDAETGRIVGIIDTGDRSFALLETDAGTRRVSLDLCVERGEWICRYRGKLYYRGKRMEPDRKDYGERPTQAAR
jgi:zona occludens toxin